MTMENKPLLQVKDLTVTFGERHNKFTAVKNVSFDIFQGEYSVYDFLAGGETKKLFKDCGEE